MMGQTTGEGALWYRQTRYYVPVVLPEIINIYNGFASIFN